MNRHIRRDQRQAVRAEVRANRIRWVGRYRAHFQDAVVEGESEQDAHALALAYTLDDFVEVTIEALSRFRLRDDEDRWRLVNDSGKRKAFRALVEVAFLGALRSTLRNIQEAREMASQLTDRAADVAGDVSSFLGALSDLLDDDAPQVVSESRAAAPDPVRLRSPGDMPRERILDPGIPVMEAPSRSPLMARPVEDDIIEIPE